MGMIDRYLSTGGTPDDLPDDFWLTPSPPTFIPPRGVYREVVQGVLPGVVEGYDNAFWQVRTWRSGHFQESGIWLEPGPIFSVFDEEPPHVVGKPPPDTRTSTLRWREARKEWIFAWERRREHRRIHRGGAGGHLISVEEAPNRADILREYHMFFDRPGDLPAEFWEGKLPPPFDPPTDAFHYRLGAKRWIGMLPRGERPVTELIRSAGWRCVLMDDAGPQFLTSGVDTHLEGHLDDYAELARLNEPYESAQREWDSAWQKYEHYREKFR